MFSEMLKCLRHTGRFCIAFFKRAHKAASKMYSDSFSHPAAQVGRGQSCSFHGSMTHGFAALKGKARHPMEDYYVAEFKLVDKYELGLYAIYDGHVGPSVASYLKDNLFDNILNQEGFWTDPHTSIVKAYHNTDNTILDNSESLGRGGSTAVTAIIIDGKKLLVANVGDSRAVLCRGGVPIQLSVDHEPSKPSERELIEKRGGRVVILPGDVPRVDGQLAVARVFGDKSLKEHLSADPDITEEEIDEDTEFLILASDGVWKVINNTDAVNIIRNIEDPELAAKRLVDEAVGRRSKDDISCIIVRFQ